MAKTNYFKKIKDFLCSNEEFKDLFRYNLMTKDIEFTRKSSIDYWYHDTNLCDDDITHIKDYISEILNEDLNDKKIAEVILILSKRKAHHPLLGYINSLEWDGKHRLDGWLNIICGAEDNIYTRQVGRKVLCGAVARIFKPGCKFDYMMILEGGQGIGKTTMLEILGKDWYLNTHMSGPDKKDMVDIMRTAWIMEIADLAGFGKSDIQHLRAFIDRKVDRVRLPYDRRARDFPRQCIMIGTHNPSGDNQYFRDDTGNRRYWPIECKGNLNIDLMKCIRDQLWAEAVIRYKAGEKLFIEDEEALMILKSMHKRREVDNPWHTLIKRYLIGKNEVTNNEVIEGAFGTRIAALDYRDLKSKQTTVGQYMRKFGWERDGEVYKRPLSEENIKQDEVTWDE